MHVAWKQPSLPFFLLSLAIVMLTQYSGGYSSSSTIRVEFSGDGGDLVGTPPGGERASVQKFTRSSNL